ncbi:hypothetical protein G3I44_09455 [Halogeometricum borinquense]|uniref:Uncharacterized protein n=1 Tax=Halogeometricum borinquense TaxID=60847 RepID=A0A6C0UGD6_9EURY|nr:hypothetical protein [Halogeometricum borinquense]QIB74485.1 hypothetical protein G3I44_09455 [Halogeometricum borinquense]
MGFKDKYTFSRRNALKSIGVSIGGTALLGSTGTASAEFRRHIEPNGNNESVTLTSDKYEDTVKPGSKKRYRYLTQETDFDAHKQPEETDWTITITTSLDGLMSWEDGDESPNWHGAELTVNYPDHIQDNNDQQFRDDSNWIGRYGTYQEQQDNTEMNWENVAKDTVNYGINLLMETVGTPVSVGLSTADYIQNIGSLALPDHSKRRYEWSEFGDGPSGIYEFSTFAKYHFIMDPGQSIDLDVTGMGITNTSYTNPTVGQKFTLTAPE